MNISKKPYRVKLLKMATLVPTDCSIPPELLGSSLFVTFNSESNKNTFPLESASAMKVPSTLPDQNIFRHWGRRSFEI